MKTTLGQNRVKAEFNPAKNDLVDRIKNKSAEIIDALEESKNKQRKFSIVEGNVTDLFILTTSLRTDESSEERLRLTEIANTHYYKAEESYKNLLVDGERELIIELSNIQTDIETACMYAVKSCFTD